MSARPACWLVLASLLAACAGPTSPGPDQAASPPATPPASSSAPHVTGTYPAHCIAPVTLAGILPDPVCTPGRVASTDRAVVCVAGYSAEHRPPSRETNRVKAAAVRAYGLDEPSELDHLIPLSLGGSNDVRNLWPEPGPVPNGKDKVERSLLTAVCRHGADLETAQQAIAEDWTTAVEAIR